MPTRMIGSRSVDRIRAAVKSTANAVHMSAPAEEHHPSKKTLQQGSHPHMPLCFVVPSGEYACVQWVEILCRRGGRGDTVSAYPHHQGIGEPDDGQSNQPTRRNAC